MWSSRPLGHCSLSVTIVSVSVIEVETAIPMIMGSNIGTSLTNTLVSFTQVTSKEQFERAFSGATVHDCFNWLTVILLMTLETSTGRSTCYARHFGAAFPGSYLG